MTTYSMRQLGSQYAPGTTIDPRTGQPVGMGVRTGGGSYTDQMWQSPTAGMANTAANDQYNAWVAAGRPTTWNGQVVDSRGQAMDPNAWDSTFSGMAQAGGGTYTPGSQPLLPNGAPAFLGAPGTPYGLGTDPNAKPTTIGNLASGNVAFGGNLNTNASTYNQLNGGGNVGPAGTNNGGFQVGTPPAGGSGPVNFGGGVGTNNPGAGGSSDPVNTFVNNVTGGGANGNGMSIPGGQPNYPLDIGSYLNPMMRYALKNGIDTINNSAAASGSLNSGNTLKELMDFATGQASNNFNNAAQIAAGQQGFAYNVDNNDRNFDFMTNNADRNFNLQKDQFLASLGMTGLGQTNQNASVLAQILAHNILTGGQAAAGGTIGGNNAIINAIMQALGVGAGNLAVPAVVNGG